MKRRSWWIGGLGFAMGCVAAAVQTNHSRPILAKHKAPIRFVPFEDADTDLAGEHFVDSGEQGFVAGYFIVDDIDRYAVWAHGQKGEMYLYGLPGGPKTKSVRNVPYASYPGQKQWFLVSPPRERIEVTLPYDPTKFPGRYRPVIMRSGGCELYAKFKIDEYGRPYAWIAARTDRTKKFDGEYAYDNGSGGFYTYGHNKEDTDFGWIPTGAGQDGVLRVDVKLTEVGVRNPKTFKFEIRARPIPRR